MVFKFVKRAVGKVTSVFRAGETARTEQIAPNEETANPVCIQ
jgi:hypothetical protein